MRNPREDAEKYNRDREDQKRLEWRPSSEQGATYLRLDDFPIQADRFSLLALEDRRREVALACVQQDRFVPDEVVD